MTRNSRPPDIPNHPPPLPPLANNHACGIGASDFADPPSEAAEPPVTPAHDSFSPNDHAELLGDGETFGESVTDDRNNSAMPSPEGWLGSVSGGASSIAPNEENGVYNIGGAKNL